MPMDLSDRFRIGMRRLASGVSVVATGKLREPAGFLATSVSAVALEPDPCLLVCVNRAVSSHDVLMRAKVFSVNLLAATQADLAHRFSSSALRDQRFEVGQWVDLVTGAPIYRDALASFDCEISASMVVQTHSILIGRVVAMRMADKGAEPLIYYEGGFDAIRAANA